MDGIASGDSVTFGPWRYDRRPGRLLHRDAGDGWAPASLGSRAADILAILLREPGALVSKDDLMDAAWPGVSVEANNLTVQIAALRRVLDDGAAGPSCIQTVPGRGYRFVGPILAPEQPQPEPTAPAQAVPAESPAAPVTVPASARSWHWRWWAIAGAAAVMLALVLAWGGRRLARTGDAPRISLVVLPFENLGGNPGENYLAEAVTENLTTDLLVRSGAFVVTGKAAPTLQHGNIEARQIGRQFGVRYILKGGVHKIGDVLHVNAELISAERDVQLWSDRFNVPLDDIGAAEIAAANRLGTALMMEIVAVEVARGQQLRPNNPDAFDLLLRAISLTFEPPSPERMAKIQTLSERALQLDPSSVAIKVFIINQLLDDEDFHPQGRKAAFERATDLLQSIRAQQPTSPRVMLTYVHWLSWQYDRCAETVEAAQRFVDLYPNVVQAYRWLGDCETRSGRAAEAVPVLERAIQLGARDSYQSHNYRNLQYALLLLGRYDDSIALGQRALASNPEDRRVERARLQERLAAAYALTGRLDEARQALAESQRLRPFATLRQVTAGRAANPVYSEQIARVREGLRLAGMRDHAEEDADFGVPSDGRLHQEYFGPTPLEAPGATTIRTDELEHLLADRRPIVIDGLTNFAGPSIPGAIDLHDVGAGGELTDLAQDHLRLKMRDLAKAGLDTPVVAVGWNSESFDGRNLALRLAALGYTHVFWYRGGREAWKVRGLPEADLTPQDW